MEENNKELRKIIFENLIIAITVMIYFILINFMFGRLETLIAIKGIKIISFIVLLFCILVFELAYHKDSGKIAINGIEILFIAIYTLTTWNISLKLSISFQTYVLFGTYAFTIYYILKSMLMFTHERRKYLKSLSDIHEIVMKEPVKKEAKKRSKTEK